jgi:hypothetical protein
LALSFWGCGGTVCLGGSVKQKRPVYLLVAGKQIGRQKGVVAAMSLLEHTPVT